MPSLALARYKAQHCACAVLNAIERLNRHFDYAPPTVRHCARSLRIKAFALPIYATFAQGCPGPEAVVLIDTAQAGAFVFIDL